MILFRTFEAEITSTLAPTFVIIGSQPSGVSVFLENKDPLNYISYQFQGAPTNVDSSYVNLIDGSGTVGSSGILAPGAQVLVTLANGDAYTRMQASSSGGAELDVGLTQFSGNVSYNFTNGQF